MANIVIKERDLTTASISGVTDNVVYVPGYATMGPVNTPTLCNTLNDFYTIFGNKPYIFKNNQYMPGGSEIMAYKDDPEKSFIYAAELLRAGLPVLFERLSSSTLETARASINLERLVYFTIFEQNSVTTNITFTKTEDDIFVYENEALSNPIYGVKNGTFELIINDVAVTQGNGENSINLYKSGATVGYFENGKITMNEGIVEEGVSYRLTYETASNIEWVVRGELVSPEYKTLSWKVQYRIPEGELNDTDLAVSFDDQTKFITVQLPTFVTINNKVDEAATNEIYEHSNIEILAKYPGEYGNGISFEITPMPNIGKDYINFTVIYQNSIDYNKIVSLNENDDAFIGKEDFRLIKLNLRNLNQNIIKSGLFTLNKISTNLFISNNTTEDEFTYTSMYTNLTDAENDIFANIEDKSEYNIKLITSGSYPVYDKAGTYENVVNRMLLAAANRGDAIAIIDAFDEDNLELYEKVQSLPKGITTETGEDTRKYGTMILPSAKYQMQTIDLVVNMPGSFGYLKCLAGSSKSSANWYAVSGVTRGLVPNLLELNSKMTGAMSNKLQTRTGISINPITYINPYGYCIWGNRTLFQNINDLTASSFLNIRMLSNDVKKVVYTAARKLTFELNSDILWLNFKSEIEPTLERMVSGNGLTGYKITKVATSKKATVACKIRLFAVEAVEDWDITIELADNYVSIV
jgi:hypothetical protein